MTHRSLIIDAGNSMVKFAFFNGSDIENYQTYPTRSIMTRPEIATESELNKFFQKGVDYAALSSVVPEATGVIKCLIKTFVRKKLFSVQDLHLQMEIDYHGVLGEDRIMGGYAARHLYGFPVIVVDVGTAMTFSLIDEKGVFRGGMISLGPYSLLKTLAEKTSQIDMIDLEVPARNVGRNTAEAVNAGVFWTVLGALEYCITRIEEFVGRPCRVALTGGYSLFFADFIKHPVELDPFLVLRGLNVALNENIR
ncbi:MAG TPA: type III pantothenate kinase [Firmicutes bacterium]|nr:type III pantothenate kinase [Bacillota bacterium]